jgi:hypothetical protein
VSCMCYIASGICQRSVDFGKWVCLGDLVMQDFECFHACSQCLLKLVSLSRSIHKTAQEEVNQFWLNLVLENFMKNC